ncbi:MAG: type II secretion system minor pseudopilin GspK [Gammaproteobacteria bacterium]|nr:type II secretion system minor pseudopilin GspK [Gammaproteobacteria bacterium]
MIYHVINLIEERRHASSDLAVHAGERVRRVSGVALVSVLLVVALASAIASQMISRQSLTIAHARHVFEGGQARQYAFGAETYARQLLFEDWSNNNALDTLLENWALPIRPFEIEGGRIELAIVDLERRLNLNAVRSPKNLQRFKRLLAQLELDPNLADAWLDWIDGDETVYGYGAEDEDYLLAQPAYRAANQPAASASAMLAVKGFTKAAYERLMPHVALLPDSELRVNANTAGGTVLYSLGASFATEEAEAPAESAREFKDIAEAVTQYPGLRDSVEALTVTSAFFEVQVRVDLGDARAELVSTLYRDPVTGRIWLLGRDFGRRVPSTYEAVPAGTETAGDT